jgi:hypothetical protein
MAENDYTLYKGKTFSDLCKDIVKKSEEKKNQLDILITDLREMIKTPADATMMVPHLKEYIDVGIKNDEQLVKLAAVIQRIMTASKGDKDDSGVPLLTDEEKKQLMENVAKVASEANSIKVDEGPNPPK